MRSNADIKRRLHWFESVSQTSIPIRVPACIRGRFFPDCSKSNLPVYTGPTRTTDWMSETDQCKQTP